MAELTDEVLMAYADGELDGEARARVEAILQRDASCRRRLEIFRATGEALARLYQQPMFEPVPSHLVDFVLQCGRGRSTAAKPARSKKTFTSWLEKLVPQPVAWQFAAASAAAMVIGVGTGWVLHGSSGTGQDNSNSNGLVAFKDGHVFASGSLRSVLETEPSGREARISGAAGEAVTMRASLTFKDKGQHYCREYEIAMPDDRGFAGLACRTGEGKWALQVHVATAVNKAAVQSSPAAGTRAPALDTVIDSIMDSDALGKQEEAAVIANGWK